MEARDLNGDSAKGIPGEFEGKYSPLIKKDTAAAAVVVMPSQRHRVAAKRNRCCCTTLKTCGLLLLAVFFLVSLTGFVTYWCTDIVQNSIIQEMVLRNNTKTYEWWVRQPEQPHLGVRIFNYTNVERFMTGEDDKLTVQELGPYTYKETVERVNVVFHPNDTVSYQEKRDFEYVPSASVGSLDDVVVVPNMALLSSASIMKDSYYLARVGMTALFKHLDVHPFHTLKVHDYFWGYNDSLFTMGKTMSSLGNVGDDPTLEKIGLLVPRNGTSPHRISIHSGAGDITHLRVIDRYAGKDSEKFWNTEECNRIDGTDGSMFPPHLVREDSAIHIYMQDMCRKFPLVFKENVQAPCGIPAMRFQPPTDVFATDGSCFCHPDTPRCPPAGVFNATPCTRNAPIMYSFPHFYLGDPILQDMVDGLKPDEEKHAMFLDVHPEFGFPVGGESRIQINIMVRKSTGITHLKRFKDETILPIAWFEVVVDSLNPEVESALKALTFATHTFKFIILGLFVLSLLVVIAVTWQFSRSHCQRNKKKKHNLATVDYVCRQGAIRPKNK